MKRPTEKRLSKLPKWARLHVIQLEMDAINARDEKAHVEAMLPWAKPDMDWFTLFNPPHRADREIRIFTCDESGTVLLCTLGKQDYIFVGRKQ